LNATISSTSLAGERRRSSSPFLSVPFSAVIFLFDGIKRNFFMHLMIIYFLSVVYDYSIFILSFMLYFSFGWIFFIKKLFVSPALTDPHYTERRVSTAGALTASAALTAAAATKPRRQPYSQDSLQKHVIHVLFALTLALSCTLFQLIIFEILDILQPR
jgi:hypothetical protein